MTKEKHPHFLKKATNNPPPEENFEYIECVFKRYQNGTFRIVRYDITEGNLVFYGLNNENKPIYKSISSIIDSKPSPGNFDKHERPMSYLVKLK